jgi:signal peptidase
MCALALGLLAALLLATAAGCRLLIEHSDSMRPTIQTGALLITRNVPARSIRVGDIVAFDDPELHGKLVTHRVVAIHASARQIDFLTRGDANPTPEKWSASRRGTIRKLELAIPAAGGVIAWLSDLGARTVILTLSALVLSTALLRRIWRS